MRMKMKILDKNGLSGVLEIVVVVFSIIAILLLFTLPFVVFVILGYYGRRSAYTLDDYYYSMLVLLYLSDLLGLFVMYNCKKLLSNINKSHPFIMDNARRVRNIGWCSGVLALVYIVAIPFFRSFFVFVLAFVFTIIALFLAVCYELFRHAVKFKEENELTI